ncbi:hypothetical protein OOU_Y34scaffold00707g14 [Pyricularia oryzae Y34]|uniref:Uncharacterized protein n=1 Tax=Pyricularia oryzae (strain Y34) TaxID=1143189 RepID=A0AA97NSD5_PYRO3|nr:hypothetical protein OOU_Y34scaffold00707g14 [Pyricularia oryzae Y34]
MPTDITSVIIDLTCIPSNHVGLSVQAANLGKGPRSPGSPNA